MNRLAADSAAGVMLEGRPAVEAFWDYEIAGHAAAASIPQLEAMHRISPDNEDLTLGLVQAYVGYGYGWVEDAAERAELRADFAQADRHRRRAVLLYLRAKDLGLRVMRERAAGLDAAMAEGPDQVRAHLREHYTDEQDDVAPVLWTALAWGSAVQASSGDPKLLAAMPAVQAMVQHAVELDPCYEFCSGLVFLGGVEAGMPQVLGGSLDKGKRYFERALELTGRRSHAVHVNYARMYAIPARDKELYVQLLREVIEAPDQGGDVRLQNKIARRRAVRYMEQTEDLFL